MSELVPEGTPVEAEGAEAEEQFTVTPEEWQATQDRLAYFEQQLQPQQQLQQYQQQQQMLQQQYQQPQVPDPFSETYQQDFVNYQQAALAPYEQFMEQMRMQAAEEQGRQILEEQVSKVGEFNREIAWAQANLLVTQGMAPQQALEQAAKDTKEFERQAGEAYHQQQLEQLQNVAGAPRAFPANTAGAQTIGVGGYGNVPNAVTNRMFGRG